MNMQEDDHGASHDAKLDSGDWLPREEVLAGLVGRRASRLLLAIEARTAFIVAQTRMAMRLMLTGRTFEEREFDYYVGVRLAADKATRATLHDLESHAGKWAEAVPEDPRPRAALVNLFGNKYSFSYEGVPSIRTALGLDNEAVQAAYQTFTGKPLESVYADKMPPDTRPFWLKAPTWVDKQILADLEAELRWTSLNWGQVLFKQGDLGDSLYIVVNGRVRVAATEADGEHVTIGELGRGAIFGELAMLTGEPRTATVYAIRDSELIRLPKDGFDRLTHKHPRLGLHMVEELVSQMRETLTRKRLENRITTVAIVPAGPSVPLDEFARRFVRALHTHGPVLHLSAAWLDRELEEGIAQTPQDHPDNSKLVWWLSDQEQRHRFVVYQTDMTKTEWTRRCLRQADRILIVADADASPELGEIEQSLFGPQIEPIATGRELVLLHPSHTTAPSATRRWLEQRHLVRHHHMHLEDTGNFERLARFIAGRALGLVLGGGGARGFAHIGVIRVLEEAGIVVDAVGGTSFGAIVGAAVALDKGWREVYETFQDFSRHARSYFDITLPLVSLVAGRKLNELFQTHCGDAFIEDLPVNYFCVTSDLTHARVVVHDRGPLWRYVRASMSIPTVFPPLLDGGTLLADGGVFNNLPADIMSERLGGGLVLASNVSPRDDLTDNYRYGDSLSAWQLLWSRINPFVERLHAPNILSVATRTMIVGSKWSFPAQAGKADLLIDNPIDAYNLFDFGAFDELVEIGYRTAQRELEKWPEVARAE